MIGVVNRSLQDGWLALRSYRRLFRLLHTVYFTFMFENTSHMNGVFIPFSYYNTYKQLPSYTHIVWQGQKIITPLWPCLFASLSFKTPHEKTKISNNTKTDLINDTSHHCARLISFLSALFSKEIAPVVWLSFLHLLPPFNPPTLFASHYSLRFISKKVIQSDYTSVWMSVAAHRFVLVGHTEGNVSPIMSGDEGIAGVKAR